jgi:putative membrane protein insertion efficiency factor
MKKVTIFIIKIYAVVISPFIHQLLGIRTACRFPQSCSAYAIAVIQEYGILRGSQMAIRRLLACQPFSKTQ